MSAYDVAFILIFLTITGIFTSILFLGIDAVDHTGNDEMPILVWIPLGIVVVSLVGLMGLNMSWPEVRREWLKIREVELVSMSERNFVEGSFAGGLFISGGYLEGYPYYFYYQKLSDDSYKPGRVRADNSVTIYEEERGNGRLEAYEYRVIPQDEFWTNRVVLGYKYKFFIPKGSIQKKFFLP